MNRALTILFLALRLNAQPALPEPVIIARTNYFVITATDASGQTSDWSNEVSGTNFPARISWDASPSPAITNYQLRFARSSLGETNDRLALNAGTNLSVIFPPPARPVTNIIVVTSLLVFTNHKSRFASKVFFALCESDDLQTWRPTPEAANSIIATNLP